MRKLSLFFFIFTLCFFIFNLHALAESVQVTGTVPPKATDFAFDFQTTDTHNQKKQDENFTYEITYGAKSSAGIATNTILEANWTAGKAPDGTQVIDYLPGSASKGYGNTAPIIDVLNRKITWNIQGLPAGTLEKKVDFTLRTTDNYTGTHTVSFTTQANLTNQFISLPSISLTKEYQYSKPLAPSITPTPTTTSATTPTPTTTPTTDLTISNIAFSKITKDSVTINVTTTDPTRLALRYGTAANNLGRVVNLGSQTTRTQSISLEALSHATTYYFQITATGGGQSVTSDIFTFQTAQVSNPPNAENSVVIITSNGNVLVSDVKEKDKTANATALVTTDTPYEITYRLRQPMKLKAIDAVMRQTRNSNQLSRVLGTSEFVVAMQEKEPLVYVARLKTDTPGTFDILVRMQDTKGNLIEEKIAATKIMPRLSVYDKDSNEPVADARIFISAYNTKTNKYEKLPPATFDNVENPVYTSSLGSAKILLPPGKYQVAVSGFGYDERTVDFTLGIKAGEDFPRILLTKNATNLVNYLQYYTNAITDLLLKMQAAISGLAFSIRFFNLLAVFILLTSILVTILFFHLRTHVSPWHLIPYFIHHIRELFHKHTLENFCATLVDEEGKKISDARVATIDETTGEVVTSFISNKNGICYILNPLKKTKLKLLITKEGYAPKTVAIESDVSMSSHGLAIVMRKGKKVSHKTSERLWMVTEKIGGMFFEFSLLSSLVLEILFFSLFGFAKTLPFFILSLFTLFLWIFYQKEKQERKVFKKP